MNCHEFWHLIWDGLWKGKHVYTQWMMEWMWQNSNSCFNLSVGLKFFKRKWQIFFLKPLRYLAAYGRLAGNTARCPHIFTLPTAIGQEKDRREAHATRKLPVCIIQLLCLSGGSPTWCVWMWGWWTTCEPAQCGPAPAPPELWRWAQDKALASSLWVFAHSRFRSLAPASDSTLSTTNPTPDI